MSDGVLIVGVLAGIAIATAIVTATLGRWLARHGRVMAVLLSGMCVPLLIVVGSFASYDLGGNRPGDGPVMALAGSLIYAALSLPITLIVAYLMLRRHHTSSGR